jgi:hypothetical protein
MFVYRRRRSPRTWLVGEAEEPTQWRDPDEVSEDDADLAAPPLILRFDWEQSQASMLWYEAATRPVEVRAAGVRLLHLDPGSTEAWLELSADDSTRLKHYLENGHSRLLSAWGWPRETDSTELLVLETGTSFMPQTRLAQLTAREVLRCWAELDDASRAEYLQDVAARHGWQTGDGPMEPDAPEQEVPETLDSFFSEFAGVFQAFARLSERVDEALSAKDSREADRWLFASGITVKTFVDHLAAAPDAERDPALELIELLLVNDLLGRSRTRWKKYSRDRESRLTELESRVNGLLNHTRRLLHEQGVDPPFLAWLEEEFPKK